MKYSKNSDIICVLPLHNVLLKLSESNAKIYRFRNRNWRKEPTNFEAALVVNATNAARRGRNQNADCSRARIARSSAANIDESLRKCCIEKIRFKC